MPSIKDKSTVKAIAREFCSNGRDKAKAMDTIGYAESSCKSGKAVKDVYGNLRVIEAIKALDAKIGEKLDLSRETQHKKLQAAYKMAKKTKSATGMVAATREQNAMLGYIREKGLNLEKEAALQARMTTEEARLAVIVANLRTDEASKPKLIQDKTG